MGLNHRASTNAAVNLPDLLVAARHERIEEQLDVNLLGPILCARAVLPVMLEQKAGVIVNVGSVAAERPFRGQAVYAATKGGLESFTRALALYLLSDKAAFMTGSVHTIDGGYLQG